MVVRRQLSNGPEDVITAARRLAPFPGFVWLDGDGRPPYGTRSYLACAPTEIRRAFAPADASSLLPEALEEPSLDPDSDVPRWILALGIDARFGRNGRTACPSAARIEIATAARYDAVLVWEENQFRIVADDSEAFARMEKRLHTPELELSAAVGGIETDTQARHVQAISEALALIAQGEIYQVNLARVWRAAFRGHPLALFLAMREASPVPLGMYFDTGARQLCVRTMETFLQWDPRSGRALSRPIKGTVSSAGLDPEATLRGDPKEQAEHAMIVDLMRNDLGRVAQVGSVEVEELFAVEPYRGLSHMVSTVACRTRHGLTYDGLLEATFPPGSVTGCPKQRALEVIAALESHPRGFYTGAVGHISRGGNLSLAVAIRLAEIADGLVRYFAGGGIVSASDPAKEVRETEIKAKVFFDAVDTLKRAGGKERETPA